MTKIDQYRTTLRQMKEWDAYLLQESRLPGPRSNLELMQAVADVGDRADFERWQRLGPEEAPTGDPHEFLTFCGVVGLGRLLAEGEREWLPVLRKHAADPRWRTREAVAMALQRWGDADMPALVGEMEAWAEGSPLEQRAAAAGLCEPRLLEDPARAAEVLAILDRITATIQSRPDRKSADFKALRQGLGYCWSVAVAARPDAGVPLMKKWLSNPDPDIAWIMKENQKKNRLKGIQW